MPDDTPGTKDAEKAYLSRSGSEPWERAKPFAPPGHNMVGESLSLIHDFAVAIGCLAPVPGERVLDLAAGSCWVSEWLRRLNIDTVSIDIALDMLRLGRDRMGVNPGLVAGDLEHLPFRDASFDKAVCLNAFHHLPDTARGLAEIRRVLKPGGKVAFSEPGRGHADADHSTRATGEFGVTEQEIVATDFMRLCAEAGFADVRIKPVAYAIPWFDLDGDGWAAWGRAAQSKRPLRALSKMWLAFLEIFGLGKTGPLAEAALVRDLARLLRNAMEDHPIIVAQTSGSDQM